MMKLCCKYEIAKMSLMEKVKNKLREENGSQMTSMLLGILITVAIGAIVIMAAKKFAPEVTEKLFDKVNDLFDL